MEARRRRRRRQSWVHCSNDSHVTLDLLESIKVELALKVAPDYKVHFHFLKDVFNRPCLLMITADHISHAEHIYREAAQSYASICFCVQEESYTGCNDECIDGIPKECVSAVENTSPIAEHCTPGDTSMVQAIGPGAYVDSAQKKKKKKWTNEACLWIGCRYRGFVCMEYADACHPVKCMILQWDRQELSFVIKRKGKWRWR